MRGMYRVLGLVPLLLSACAEYAANPCMPNHKDAAACPEYAATLSSEGSVVTVSSSSGDGLSSGEVISSSEGGVSSSLLSSMSGSSETALSSEISSVAASSVAASSVAPSSSEQEISSSAVVLSSSAPVTGRQCTYDQTDSPRAGAGTLSCGEKSYKTVTMGGQVWMAENLNFGAFIANSAVSPATNQSDATPTSAQKFCLNNLSDHCDTYGALYQWHTAMALPADCDTINVGTAGCIKTSHGICPQGWHLPTNAEWNTLKAWTDGQNSDATDDEGAILKSVDYWESGAGSDDFKWRGLPGGFRNLLQFDGKDGEAYWWSSTESEAKKATFRTLFKGNSKLDELSDSKQSNAVSVRCVKD